MRQLLIFDRDIRTKHSMWFLPSQVGDSLMPNQAKTAFILIAHKGSKFNSQETERLRSLQLAEGTDYLLSSNDQHLEIIPKVWFSLLKDFMALWGSVWRPKIQTVRAALLRGTCFLELQTSYTPLCLSCFFETEFSFHSQLCWIFYLYFSIV